MKNKKREYKRWKQERTPEKIIAAFSSFFLYESAHLPQIIAWAKKTLKNTKREPKISKGTPSQRLFTHSVRPSIYRKMELINAALSVSDVDFMEMYEKFSPSDFASREDLREIMNYDDRLRVSAVRIFMGLKNHKNISKLLDEDPLLNRYFHYTIDMIHSRDSYKSVYEKRLDNLSSEARRRMALVTKICSELEFGELMTIAESHNSWPILREMMAMNNVVLTDFWKTKIPKDDVARIVEVVFAFTNEDDEDEAVSFTDMVFNKLMGRSSSDNDNNPLSRKPRLDENEPSLNTILQKPKLPENLISNSLFDNDFLAKSSTHSFEEDISLLLNALQDSVEKSMSDHFEKVMNMVLQVVPFLMTYKFVLLYKEARDYANSGYDEVRDLTLKLNEEIAQNKEDFRRELIRHEYQQRMRDIELAKKKQEQLNQLQLQYDRLLAQKLALESENEFLKDIIENENDSDANNVPIESFDDDTDDEPDIIKPYPKGTVLFGGHENWQRKFAKRHPEVKILSGTENFPENVVSPLTPLVLLNSKHMSHKFFFKIRRLQQRQGWTIEYVG